MDRDNRSRGKIQFDGVAGKEQRETAKFGLLPKIDRNSSK